MCQFPCRKKTNISHYQNIYFETCKESENWLNTKIYSYSLLNQCCLTTHARYSTFEDVYICIQIIQQQETVEIQRKLICRKVFMCIVHVCMCTTHNVQRILLDAHVCKMIIYHTMNFNNNRINHGKWSGLTLKPMY